MRNIQKSDTHLQFYTILHNSVDTVETTKTENIAMLEVMHNVGYSIGADVKCFVWSNIEYTNMLSKQQVFTLHFCQDNCCEKYPDYKLKAAKFVFFVLIP